MSRNASSAAKILLVEDDLDIARSLGENLEDLGYVVSGKARSHDEALSKLETTPPDLVLMDVRLCGQKDGIETATEIRKRSAVPIIFTSVDSDRDTIERARSTNFAGYLFKPYDVRELQILIEVAIGRQRVERMLSESAEMFKAIVRETTDGVVVADLDGRIIFWNQGAETIFGFREREVLGKSVSQVLPKVAEAHRESLAREPSSMRFADVPGRRRDGSDFHAEVTLTSWRSGDSVFLGCIVRDITHNRMQQDSHFLLEKALENTQVGVTVADKEGRILFTNAAEARMHGYTIDELLGKSVRIFAPQTQWKETDLKKRREGGFKRESVNVDKDGRAFPVEIVSDIVKDAHSNPIAIVSCTQDITERTKHEEERRLIESARLKSEFIANVSHELRTPLNAVIGSAGLLFDTKLDSKQYDYAAMIQQAGETLLALINDVLDLSKLESGKLSLEETEFDIESVCKESIDLLEQQAKVKGLAMRFEIAPEVSGTAKSDPGRLRQILVNLVGNAVKFTREGVVELSVRPDGRAGWIRFEVRDTGVGIPKTSLPKLFQPFSQANPSTTREYGGTGLGLSICKNLVALFGGTIDVESDEGKGSRFWFAIPLSPSAPSQPRAEPERAESSATDLTEMRALIVEDNAFNQRIIVAMLEKLGCHVDSVANGREALHALARLRYDLVLMDCQMPVMDGYTATRIIRAAGAPGLEAAKNIPIIAMTAHAMTGDREKCLEAGMTDYISKPIDQRRLAKLLLRYSSARSAEPPADPPSETALSSRAVNPKSLEDLRSLNSEGKPDLAAELINLFLTQAPRKIESIRSISLYRSCSELEREAHTLKSNCAQIGAAAMASICKAIESDARRSDLSRVEQRLEALTREYERVELELREELESTAPGPGT